MGRLLMQLPQSVFGIRSNTVVLFKQHIGCRGLAWRGRTSVFPTKADVLLAATFKAFWVLFKRCPRFPLRRQNKDNEATESTPRKASTHVNIMSRSGGFSGFTLKRSCLKLSSYAGLLCSPPSLFWDLVMYAISIAAAAVVASVCYLHPVLAQNIWK